MSARPTTVRWLVVSAYTALGAVLVVTRTVGLGRSLWHDEVIGLVLFIREGPRTILAGDDLNHELFALLAWATTSLAGESEIALRLWSVLPFILGVGLVTAWLHARVSPLSAVLFALFATLSPLLLDISRQARGYGLAFLAMGVLVVAALEGLRTRRTWTIAAFCAAGVVGTCTLPQFGIAFLATGAVLLSDRAMRRPAGIGLGLALVAVVIWYSPHLGEVRDASRIEDGVQIGTLELLAAPFHHVVIPALVWIDGTVVVASLVWLPFVLLVAGLMSASPLLRELRPALALGSGIVATIVVLWVAQAYVIPRYLSYLLVPAFVLLATGCARLLAAASTRPRALVPALGAVVAIGIVTVAFASVASDVLRYPREAYKDAARAIEREDESIPVLAYLRNEEGLELYLDRPFRALEPENVAGAVCANEAPVFFVTKPFGIREVELPCLDRPGTRLRRFPQYARGNRMDVWFVPPAGSA